MLPLSKITDYPMSNLRCSDWLKDESYTLDFVASDNLAVGARPI